MKNKSVNSRKLRYGGVTAALTALIIAAIILFNVVFTLLSSKYTWYIDLTPDYLFTLSDASIDLIKNGDDTFDTVSPIEMVDKIRAENKAYNAENNLSAGSEGYRDENLCINIIFCDDPDIIKGTQNSAYVYNTALELQSEFPDYIKVINYNIIRNPSSVYKYRQTSTTNIATTDVIVEFGTEYKVYTIKNFYTFDTDTGEAWAYNGEMKLASGILAVTRAESPIACFTTSHGEATPDDAFRNTLSDAGYTVQTIDLASQPIPEDCRLIVIFNPQSDFLVKNSTSDVDEIKILDEFLDGTNSLMVFMDANTNKGQRLNYLEDYLEEWGISFDRTKGSDTEHPYIIRDSSQSLTTDGFTIKSEYAEGGLASITSDMRNSASPKDVIFSHAMSLSYSPLYDTKRYVDAENSAVQYDYGSYYSNGISRAIFDIFVTGDKAVAHANGVEVAKATKLNPFKLMTISVEERNVQSSNYDITNEASYVVACGSTQFASAQFLENGAYGNNDLLLSVCRAIGHEPVPIGIERKPFADYTIDTITTKEATQYTIVFTVVPVVIATVCGAVVLIRRKNK